VAAVVTAAITAFYARRKFNQIRGGNLDNLAVAWEMCHPSPDDQVPEAI
jgi:hypothetical protein